MDFDGTEVLQGLVPVPFQRDCGEGGAFVLADEPVDPLVEIAGDVVDLVGVVSQEVGQVFLDVPKLWRLVNGAGFGGKQQDDITIIVTVECSRFNGGGGRGVGVGIIPPLLAHAVRKPHPKGEVEQDDDGNNYERNNTSVLVGEFTPARKHGDNIPSTDRAWLLVG